MSPVLVLADDRESGSSVVELLRQSPEFHVTVSRLKLGDYLVDNRFIFERKTLADLVAAIVDGRLFGQATRLAASRLRPAIILEGTSRDLAGRRIRVEAVQGALVTVALFCGIPILRTRTSEETVRTMLFAARQAQTCIAGALPRHGHRPQGKIARQLYILQGFPGIGPERARKLVTHFGTVSAIVNARTEDLQFIDGIGRRLAQKFRWSVDEPPVSYP